jgi:hypothetical protein
MTQNDQNRHGSFPPHGALQPAHGPFEERDALAEVRDELREALMLSQEIPDEFRVREAVKAAPLGLDPSVEVPIEIDGDAFRHPSAAER